jgi:hypothetical protein
VTVQPACVIETPLAVVGRAGAFSPSNRNSTQNPPTFPSPPRVSVSPMPSSALVVEIAPSTCFSTKVEAKPNVVQLAFRSMLRLVRLCLQPCCLQLGTTGATSVAGGRLALILAGQVLRRMVCSSFHKARVYALFALWALLEGVRQVCPTRSYREVQMSSTRPPSNKGDWFRMMPRRSRVGERIRTANPDRSTLKCRAARGCGRHVIT